MAIYYKMRQRLGSTWRVKGLNIAWPLPSLHAHILSFACMIVVNGRSQLSMNRHHEQCAPSVLKSTLRADSSLYTAVYGQAVYS